LRERRGEWKKGEGEEVKVDGQFAAIGSKPSAIVEFGEEEQN